MWATFAASRNRPADAVRFKKGDGLPGVLLGAFFAFGQGAGGIEGGASGVEGVDAAQGVKVHPGKVVCFS